MHKFVQSQHPDGETKPVTPYMICVDLQGQRVCVVGGGSIAARKVESLLTAGAEVHVIAPDLCTSLRNWLADPALARRLFWHEGPYQRNLPTGARLVIACTDDREVNRQVLGDCRIVGVLCNVVDDPELCDFAVPAVRTRGVVQVAVSTAGSSPSLAREVADHLIEQIDPMVADLVQLLSEIRLEVRAQITDTASRKDLHGILAGSESLQVLRGSGKDGWRDWYRRQLARYRHEHG